MYDKFNPGWGDKEILELIELALKYAKGKGLVKPTDIDGYIFDCGRVVGASKGQTTRKIKIHINRDGRNLHAFPYN